MKTNSLKNYFLLLVLITIFSCKKSGSTSSPIPVIEPTVPPTITSITPSKGLPGTLVTITGTNFSPTLVNDTVRFNGVLATIQSVTNTTIQVLTPTDAISGNIVVFTPKGTTDNRILWTVNGTPYAGLYTVGSSGYQTPVQSIIRDSGATSAIIGMPTVTAYGQAGGAELGYRVHFDKVGSIKKLGIANPTTGIYQLSFWNNSTQKLLATTSVTVVDSVHFFYATIPSISVYADTQYVVSCHINDGSQIKHWLFSNVNSRNLYPFQEGDVFFEQLLDAPNLPLSPINVAVTPVFPGQISISSDQRYITPICDFQFYRSSLKKCK